MTVRIAPRFCTALVAAAALLHPTPATALDPNRTLTQALHRIWQMQQGLPQATIYCLRQTADGYLWLGTQTWLVRFDGVRFTSVTRAGNVSLENLWVRDLLEDSDHAVWVATDGAGLFRLHNGSATHYAARDGLPSDTIYQLLSDRSGKLWACTAGGLAAFDGGRFTSYGADDGLPTKLLRAACLDRDGRLVVAGDGAAIATRDGSRFTTRALRSLPPNASVRALLRSRDGTLFIGSTTGLVLLKDGHERRFTEADGLADDWVFCLAESRDGTLWVGTKEGFSRFRNGEFESFRTKDGLSQSTVYTLTEDREASLWVGTKHGLNQFLDRRTIPFTASEGLPTNDTGPVFQDRAGDVWVGTLGAGLARFDGRRFVPALTAGDGLASDAITALADDGNGNLWVGTDKGLNRVSGGRVRQTFTTADGLPANTVRCLLAAEGALWVGTSAGLVSRRDGRCEKPAGADAPLRAPILALAPRRDRSLVVSTEGGGLYACAGAVLHELPAGQPPRRDADALFEDADGLLWIGTLGGGLRMLDGQRVFAYSLRDGLFDDDIYGIAADAAGRLWMACSKGVFSVSRSDLRSFAAGKMKTVTSAPFSPMDALRTIECKPGVEPGVCRLADGRLCFSTIRGIILIDPSHLQRHSPPAPLVVEEVIVNGQAQPAAGVGELPPGRTNLEFRYTGLSFLSPARMTFRYRLEGFDKDWIDAGGRREAFYTNLPPGSYKFRVAATNVDGTTSEGDPVAFTLTPYFYQRAWFLPLCAALAALAVWAGYRMRVRRIKENVQTILAERGRIARELHDTLMQGFSGITMEMQALSSRLPDSPQRQTLHEIIDDAGTCLREARLSIAGLRSPAGPESGLASSIAQAARQITEAKDLRLKLRLQPCPRGLAADVEYNLLRIAQEAVANAAKHSGARDVQVSLDRTPQSLRLLVTDDGAGFVPIGNGDAAGHYGIVGMRERAAQIGADLHIDSSPGRGTTVSVTVPLPAGVPAPVEHVTA
jgi:signal transduction histidine kinase/ligand-binding sensor domain-containing protein